MKDKKKITPKQIKNRLKQRAKLLDAKVLVRKIKNG